jgi:hypothetical protein
MTDDRAAPGRHGRGLARLQQPNILTVFDFGEEGGVPYPVGEPLEGGTLEQQLGAPLPVHAVVWTREPLSGSGYTTADAPPSKLMATPVM